MSSPRLISQPGSPKLCSIKDLEAGDFSLDAQELVLFDSIAVEHTEKSGTSMLYWHLNRVGTTIDPVYDEPVQRKFEGPFRLKGNITYPESSPEAREQGMRSQWNATVWIPRKTLELANAPEPDVGDVIQVWNNSFFMSDGVESEQVPGAQFMFVVIDANTDGHLFDTPSFVGFKLEVERRTEYTPERFLASQ